MKTLENILNEIPTEFINAIKECKQDPEWHAEGDVYIHTCMVYSELMTIFDREEFSDYEKEVLQYAVILHDIGKPKCTSIEDGRIRQHGHSRLGYHIALEVLQHLPFQKRYDIAMLIKEHGNPNWLFESDNAEYDVIKTSHLCNIKLLLTLVEADVKGRIANLGDTENFLLSVEYFRELAQEFNCYETPYEFNHELVKFCYFKRKSHYHTDFVYDYTRSRVVMMSGLPGTGKDTYIRKHLADYNIISLDDLRKEYKISPTDKKGQGTIIQKAKELAKGYLRKGEPFVWNATNTSKQMRGQLIDLFDDYNAHITIIYIENDIKTILSQNKQREEQLPDGVIQKLFRKLEIPTSLEAHNVIIHKT